MVMEKIEIAPGIIVYRNIQANPEEIISGIEESVEAGIISWQQAYVRSSDSDDLDTSKRDTLAIGVPYSDGNSEDLSSPSASFYSELGKIFLNALGPSEQDYLNTFGIGVDSHDAYSVLKYGVGQKFTNHIDDHPVFHRRVSLVYYMNDNYSGGQINFPRFGISYKPAANEILMFPSTYVYNHSVSEVTEGTRYAVVSWMK
jgi:hypothetical protein